MEKIDKKQLGVKLESVWAEGSPRGQYFDTTKAIEQLAEKINEIVEHRNEGSKAKNKTQLESRR